MIDQYFLIRPDRIGWFRFILEGYDGLWLLSTLDGSKGLVRVVTHPKNLPDLYLLLGALAPTLLPRTRQNADKT